MTWIIILCSIHCHCCNKTFKRVQAPLFYMMWFISDLVKCFSVVHILSSLLYFNLGWDIQYSIISVNWVYDPNGVINITSYDIESILWTFIKHSYDNIKVTYMSECQQVPHCGTCYALTQSYMPGSSYYHTLDSLPQELYPSNSQYHTCYTTKNGKNNLIEFNVHNQKFSLHRS